MKATIRGLCFIENIPSVGIRGFSACARSGVSPKTQAAKGGLFFEVAELWL
jgi:hypothetical protein